MAWALRILSVTGAVLAVQGQDAEPDPFDCQAGIENWQAGWSVEKKEWCCANKNIGCPEPPPPPPPPPSPPPPPPPPVAAASPPEVVRRLETVTAAPEIKVDTQEEKNEKFWLAAAKGLKEEADIHLKAGADVNHGRMASKGSSAIYALACGNPPNAIETAQWLIQSKADINARDSRGRTPLFCAALSGNTKFVEVFAAAEDKDPHEGHRVTALNRAARRGDSGMCETLLKMRADPHFGDGIGGGTAYMHAESEGDLALKKVFGITDKPKLVETLAAAPPAPPQAPEATTVGDL